MENFILCALQDTITDYSKRVWLIFNDRSYPWFSSIEKYGKNNESKSLSLVILEPRTNFRTFWELEWPKNQMTRRVLKGETKSGNNIMNTIYVPKSERCSWIRVTRATLLKKATTNLHQYIHYSPRLPSPICRLP